MSPLVTLPPDTTHSWRTTALSIMVAKREKISLASLLGYIGHTRYYNSNKKLALLFQSIWHGNEPDTSKAIPIETAVYLKEKNLISKKTLH